MGKATQVRHAGIVVANLERAIWFYRDLLGLAIQRRMVESGACIEKVLALPGVEVETVKLGFGSEITQIELLSFLSHPVAVPAGNRALLVGPTHVAFTVDDLQELYQQMNGAGIEFNCPPQSSSDGKVLLTYCKDPDSNLVELVEIR